MEGLDTSSNLSENPKKVSDAESLRVNTTSRYSYHKHHLSLKSHRPTQEQSLKPHDSDGSTALDVEPTRAPFYSARSMPGMSHTLIALNYSGKGLTAMPQTIKDSRNNLLILDLSCNSFREFPVEILQLSKLKSLKLDSNKLKKIPPEISDLKQLEYLSLSCNYITSLPITISQLSKSLGFLNVAQNYIDKLPEEIAELTNLKVLSLQNNWFTFLPIRLYALIMLREFTLEWFKYTFPPLSPIQNDPGRENIVKLFELSKQLEKAGQKEVTFEAFVQYFSISNKDILSIRDSSHRNLMHVAALEQKPEVGVIRSLATYRPHLLDDVDQSDQTPLLLSIREEKDLVAIILLRNKANPNLGSGSLGSPLHIATARCRVGLVKELLRYGADPNIVDLEGNTPLHILCSMFSKDVSRSREIGTMLVSAGAQPNSMNYDGWTPLHLGIRREQVECLKWMLEMNRKNGSNGIKTFDLNIKGGSDRWTPLHLASSMGQLDILTLLGNDDIDFGARTRTGKTPREVASSNFLVCKMLKRMENGWIHKQLFRHTTLETKLKELSTVSNVCQLKNMIHDSLKKPPESFRGMTTNGKKTLEFSRKEIAHETKATNDSNSKTHIGGYHIPKKASLQLNYLEKDSTINPGEESSVTGDVDEVVEIKETARVIPKSPNNIQKIQIAQNYRDHILKVNKSSEIEHPITVLSERYNLSKNNRIKHKSQEFVFPIDFNKYIKNFESYIEEIKSYQNLLLKESEVPLSEKLKVLFYMQVLHMKMNGSLKKMSSKMIPVELFVLCEHLEDELKKNQDPAKKDAILRNYDIIPRTLLFVFENLDSKKSLKNAQVKLKICRLFGEFKYEPAKHFLRLLVDNPKENTFLRKQCQASYELICKNTRIIQMRSDNIFSERILTNVLVSPILSPKQDKQEKSIDLKKTLATPPSAIISSKPNKRALSEMGPQKCGNIAGDDDNIEAETCKQLSSGDIKNAISPRFRVVQTPLPSKFQQSPTKYGNSDVIPASEDDIKVQNMEIKATPKKSRADTYFKQG